MSPEERFERIEALLHAMAERGTQIEKRANARMDRFEQSMARADKKWNERWAQQEERWAQQEERWARADARMDRMDRQIQATEKLVRAGMKMVMRLGTQIAELKAEVKEIAQLQRAMLRSARNGRNGGTRHS